MATVSDTPCDLKTRTADRVLRWLFGQEAVVVVLCLILVACCGGLWVIYRDMRADTRDARVEAVEKQTQARQEYLQQLAQERARSEAAVERNAAAIERFGERVGGSIDRLTDEVRRTRP